MIAQVSGLTRVMVGKHDVSVTGREAVIARVEVAPGVKAGEALVIPAGVVHDAHNSGAAPIRLVGVHVVEKGKPLATPAL